MYITVSKIAGVVLSLLSSLKSKPSTKYLYNVNPWLVNPGCLIVVVHHNNSNFLLKWHRPHINSLGFINPGLTGNYIINVAWMLVVEKNMWTWIPTCKTIQKVHLLTSQRWQRQWTFPLQSQVWQEWGIRAACHQSLPSKRSKSYHLGMVAGVPNVTHPKISQG